MNIHTAHCRRFPVAIAVVLALAAGVATHSASAGTKTWNGLPLGLGTTKWSYESFFGVSNWGGSGVPRNLEDLVFTGSNKLTNENDYLELVGNLRFAAGAGAFTLEGNRLKIFGSINNDSSVLQTINIPLTVGATAMTWSGGSPGMNLNGAFSLGAHALTLTNKITIDNAGADITIGDSGTAALTLESGSRMNSVNGWVGLFTGSTGAVTVDGEGSNWTNSSFLGVGKDGTGTLTIQNGGQVSNGNAFLGYAGDATGTVTVNGAGSTWTNSHLYVGFLGTSTLNIQNGGKVVADSVTIGYLGAGAVHLGDSGQLSTVQGTSLSSGRRLTFSGNATVEGNFANHGEVVGSAGTLTFLGDVNGAGTFAGDIVFHAGHSPGDSPASVSFQGGNVTYDPTAVLTLEILGATPGSEYDQLTDIGLLSFNGTLRLVFGNDYVPAAGASFALLGFQTFSGSLAPDRIQVEGFDPAKLDVSRLALDGSLSVAAVPEPETYAMMLAGLGLLGWMTRRHGRSPRGESSAIPRPPSAY